MINTKHDPGTSIGSTARIGRTAHRVQYGLAPLHLLFDSKDVKEKKKEKKKEQFNLSAIRVKCAHSHCASQFLVILKKDIILVDIRPISLILIALVTL